MFVKCKQYNIALYHLKHFIELAAILNLAAILKFQMIVIIVKHVSLHNPSVF